MAARPLPAVVVGALALALVPPSPVWSQEAPTSRAVIGVEPGGGGALRALQDRQVRLEDALRAIERRLQTLAEAAEATTARIARGDDPLVALEIEQLWSLVESLERDNALLRERLDALEAGLGERRE